MDYSEGIPPEPARWWSVPTMLTRPEAIDDLLEALEIRYLANRETNIHFALLTDFRDAAAGDDARRRRARSPLARAGIEALNAEIRRRSRPTSSFCSTARGAGTRRKASGWATSANAASWPISTRCCRGEEASRCSFASSSATRRFCQQVQYVITLDTDTQLPRDAARELVGTIGASAESAELSIPSNGRVTEGYSILQPRVGISLPSASRSWFVRLFAGEPGIDPYTRAVSDVYQDVFDEGSFIGKGIYDVDAFEQTLADRFPDNADPQPRSARRLLRPLGAGQRRGAVRGISRRATWPTSAGGTAGFAATGRSPAGCCRACPAPDGRSPCANPAVAAVALEDFRQPAPQPRPGGAAGSCCWPAGCCFGRRWAADLTAVRAGDRSRFRFCCRSLLELSASRRNCRCGMHLSAGLAAAGRPARRPVRC